MFFDKMNAFIASQISSYDPNGKDGRGIPSNSLAAGYPWIYAHISDEGGFKLGSSGGVPVFIDFFRRDSERVNSNMVIIGKSGSGKSYATKSILSNLASEDAKIFILDPENEYSELAANLHGKVINVANAQFGRLNPFNIITALDDDEEGDASGSFSTHLQFLEEFYRQILPDIDKDALEYLNNLTERLYTNKGITPETDLSKLRPEDYPIFDDLYDSVLEEFERTDNEYIRSMLRLLVNYIAKFSTGGRNANIWNGPSTITTDENFTVFNFQAMISNRNTTIANAQMLLVLKYIDNEIIKNRDYNSKYGLHRKVVVVIDEAHVFIDSKFPVALDFMFQLAKRIRKYNGMQIVITQNIKDFVGSEEIARKSTAIINACQYSFIFALAPNDMHDLVKLYEKAGGINETEQEQIIQAPRGQAFTVMSSSSRSTFRVEVPKNMVDMFQDRDFESRYYTGTEGEAAWESFVADSRDAHNRNLKSNKADNVIDFEEAQTEKKSRIKFEEISADSEEAIAFENKAKEAKEAKKADTSKITLDESDDDFMMSDDDLDALIAKRRAEKAAIYMEATPSAAPQPAPAAPVTPIVQVVQAPAPAVDYDAIMSELREKLVKEVVSELSESGMLRSEAADKAPAESIEAYKAPERDELLDEEPYESYEPEASFEAAEDEDDLFDDLFDEEESIPDDEIVAMDTEPELTEEELDIFEAEEPEIPETEEIEDIDFEDEYDIDDEADEEEIEEYDFSSLFDDDEDESSDDEDESDDGSTIDVMSLLYDSADETEPEKDKKGKEKEVTHITDLSEIAGPGEVADITIEDLADIVSLIRKKKRNMEE
ncbi:MAG: DUF87 domain-containing protein [Lachnospiraceae bacterium]|nr:DUF87 domain-containing protein [Lachnospiraceae bacterium]